MDFSDGLIIAVIVLIVAASFLYTHITEKRRREAMQQLAQSLGFFFADKGRPETSAKHQVFKLFSRGHGQKIRNEMWGIRNNLKLCLFGYFYTEGSGKNSRTYRQTVFSVEDAHLHLPAFELRPENALHRIEQFFGYQDIDFEGHPEFSKSYLLRGEDETRIQHLFSPRIIEFFEANKGLCVEGHGNSLIFYYLDERCEEQAFEPFIAKGESLVKLFLGTA